MRELADEPTDVLFGLIALHNDMIAPATAAAALRARDGHRAVSEILVAEGALTPRQRNVVDTLCHECIERHGGDALLGLAGFVTAGTGRERLDRIGDDELTESLKSIGTTFGPEPPATPRATKSRQGTGRDTACSACTRRGASARSSWRSTPSSTARWR